jgi:hypothetical protein
MKHAFVCLAASALLVSCQSPAPTAGPTALASARLCSSPASAEQVSETIRSFFAALTIDDDAAVRRLTTPNFYAFEIGKRLTGPELSKIIADAHKSGRTIQWNIGPVDAHVDCNIAFAAWENTGAAGTAAKMEPRAWLESALLLRQGDRWVIQFLHSTPKDPRK